jgi:hypothetical protein
MSFAEAPSQQHEKQLNCNHGQMLLLRLSHLAEHAAGRQARMRLGGGVADQTLRMNKQWFERTERPRTPKLLQCFNQSFHVYFKRSEAYLATRGKPALN